MRPQMVQHRLQQRRLHTVQQRLQCLQRLQGLMDAEDMWSEVVVQHWLQQARRPTPCNCIRHNTLLMLLTLPFWRWSRLRSPSMTRVRLTRSWSRSKLGRRSGLQIWGSKRLSLRLPATSSTPEALSARNLGEHTHLAPLLARSIGNAKTTLGRSSSERSGPRRCTRTKSPARTSRSPSRRLTEAWGRC